MKDNYLELHSVGCMVDKLYFEGVRINLKQIKELIKHASEISYYLEELELYRDEQKHLEECNEKEKQNHIYNSVKQLEDITTDLLHQIY